jgi:hypothetical protein
MITDLHADRGQAQAERVALWLRSEEAFYRQQREELRAEWCEYHKRLARSHRSLAWEHDRAAAKLLEQEAYEQQ